MPQFFHDEIRSFTIFLIALLITVGLILSEALPVFAIGALGILWGGFGFFRLIHIMQNRMPKMPNILTLPARLLFGLGHQQEMARENILYRLERPDVIAWFVLTAFFIGWMIVCTFFPAEISVVQDLQAKQQDLLGITAGETVDLYALMKAMTFYGMAGIIIFLSLTFCQSRHAVQWSYFLLLPLFIVGAVFILKTSPFANPALLPDMAVMKGGGIGKAALVAMLEPMMMAKMQTGIMMRFIESGWVGAYGAHAVFLPAAFMMSWGLFKKRYVVRSILGLLIITLVQALDIIWLSSPLVTAVSLLGLATAALLWGTIYAIEE